MTWYARQENWKPQAEDARRDGDTDYARVIHSYSFRRLQGKTQILNLGDSDFYRTRLTHSLEVAQIAAGILLQFEKQYPNHPAAKIFPDRSLIQAIGCTHDLGHPPFGHGGEVALNYCMRDNGGFEGNGQSLRILSKLEKFSDNAGSNLTRRTLLGVLKYPVAFKDALNAALVPSLVQETTTVKIIDTTSCKPPKCYLDSEQDVVDWLLKPLSQSDRTSFQSFDAKTTKHHKPLHKSFDCSIMDLADDMSFGVHDLEDVIAMGLVSREQFCNSVEPAECAALLDYLSDKYKAEYANDVYGKMVGQLFGSGADRKHLINRILNFLIPSVEIETLDEFDEPLIKYRAKMKSGALAFLEALKTFVMKSVILAPSVQHLEFKGQTMVVSVFEVICSDPKRFLPSAAFAEYEKADDPMRVICDHIAGMTDAFLLKTYDRLFSPHMGSVFDRL